MMTIERANTIAEIIKTNTDFEATANTVRKGDNILIGISVGEKESRIRPNIYLEQFENLSNDEIAEKVVMIYEDNQTPILDMSIDDFSDYEKIKDRLIVCIRKQTKNQEDVKKKYLDMELYVRFIINTNNDTVSTVVVKKEHAKRWGINPQTIIAQARKNSEKHYTIDGMADVLRELGHDDPSLDETFELKPMYVIGNENKYNGASVINSTKVLSKLANSIYDSLYIIPSSIHEILALPKSLVDDIDYMKEMIRDVNDTMVRPEEILSYNLYYFDKETKKVYVA